MKILPFVQALMPTFTKDTLEVEFEELQKVINNINIPYLEGAVKQLGNYKFKTELTDTLETQLTDNVRLKKTPNFLHSFLEVAKRIRDQLPTIQKMIDEYFEEDVSVHSLNLQRVNLLQYIPVLTFVARYMRTFTNYALGLEINLASETATPTYDLIPAERQWLKDNRQIFLDSVRITYHHGSKLEKVFEQLPEVHLDPSNAKMIEQSQGAKADPLGFGFIPLAINPFFWVGKMVVNYQTERYHLARGELEMLERKVYNLRLINQGRPDAKIERDIKYLEEKRINPLKEKIMEWEQEYVNNA